jgi:hypothetical protein
VQCGRLGAGGRRQFLSRPRGVRQQVRNPQPARDENSLDQQTPRDQLVHAPRGGYLVLG